jgi:hypothetical protein
MIKMGDELIKKDKSLPMVVPQDDLGYGEEISSEGIQLPIIKLCQNATRERPAGCIPGDFYNATTGKVYGKKIVTNVFKSFRGRIKFTPDYKLECKSIDGKHGVGMTGEKVLCASCPYSSWKNDEKERKVSYCPPVITFLSLVEGDFIPGLIGFSKTREKIANKINSMLRYLIAENIQLPAELRVPVYFFKVEISSQQTEYNGNQIYEIDAKVIGKEEDTNRKQMLVGLFREWKAFEHTLKVFDKEESSSSEKNEVTF